MCTLGDQSYWESQGASVSPNENDLPFALRGTWSAPEWHWWILLTHWGQVMHICVGKLTIIGSDNGLSPGRCQAIMWTNAGILLIRSLRTNFSEILREIHSFSLKKNAFENVVWKMAAILSRPQCVNKSFKRYHTHKKSLLFFYSMYFNEVLCHLFTFSGIKQTEPMASSFHV